MRNLLSRGYESLGVEQKVWMSLETGGFGDNATGGLVPVDADALEHITCNIVYDHPREDSAARSGRSVAVRHSMKKTVEWSYESYIIPGIPSGVNPTLPPVHEMILSAFGEVDETNPAKKIYKLATRGDKSFRILEEMTHFSRLAVGCVADEITFSFPGDGKAILSASGFGQDVYFAGWSTLAQALAGVAQKAEVEIQDLTLEAVSAGTSGNLINVAYIDGATAGFEVVTVTGNNIVVEIEDAVSTATQIKAAIDGSLEAAALVDVTITGIGGTAQDVVAATFLVGGLGANQLKVQAGEAIKYDVGSYIDLIAAVDGNTISNQKFKVTSIGTGVNADVITVDATLAVALSGDIVIGHAPETYLPVSGESANVGLKGEFSFGSMGVLDCQLISADVTLTNNYTKKDFIAFTSKICGYVADQRRGVSLNIDLMLNKDNAIIYSKNKKFVAENVTLKLMPQDVPAPSYPDAAGRTFTFNFPRVEFNIPSIEAPADAYQRLTLEGIAMAVDMNNLDSEVTLTIE